MGLGVTDKLGAFLGAFQTRQRDTQRNLAPDETSGFIIFKESFPGDIVAERGYTIKKWEYKSDAFIIDHPIQCDLDSAVYKLDEGYTPESPTIIETGGA